jgi:N-acetyl-anhydromuramyl-L-alanine amidase AmpD
MAKAKKTSLAKSSANPAPVGKMNIKQIQFAPRHYMNEVSPKSQIYLHHTAGNDNAEGVFAFWSGNNERIATCVVIDSKGLIVQGFPSQKWAYHLGLSNRHFNPHGLRHENLDRTSIGIEICNWGFLTPVQDGDDVKYLNYVGREVPKDSVIELDKPFKGYKFWHSYTDAQIESVRRLLLLWKERYGIPLDYNEDIWGLTTRALKGERGVFTHNSVRRDKTDVYPHPKLIQMLKELNG